MGLWRKRGDMGGLVEGGREGGVAVVCAMNYSILVV